MSVLAFVSSVRSPLTSYSLALRELTIGSLTLITTRAWEGGPKEHSGPLWICLPGTELLQSPLRTEFSMGSLLRRYWWSLWHHRRFLRSYRWSLRHCHDPWGGRWPARSPMPIIEPLTKHRTTLLNIVKHHETLVKHHETLVKHCDTSLNIVNH